MLIQISRANQIQFGFNTAFFQSINEKDELEDAPMPIHFPMVDQVDRRLKTSTTGCLKQSCIYSSMNDAQLLLFNGKLAHNQLLMCSAHHRTANTTTIATQRGCHKPPRFFPNISLKSCKNVGICWRGAVDADPPNTSGFNKGCQMLDKGPIDKKNTGIILDVLEVCTHALAQT